MASLAPGGDSFKSASFELKNSSWIYVFPVDRPCKILSRSFSSVTYRSPACNALGFTIINNILKIKHFLGYVLESYDSPRSDKIKTLMSKIF